VRHRRRGRSARAPGTCGSGAQWRTHNRDGDASGPSEGATACHGASRGAWLHVPGDGLEVPKEIRGFGLGCQGAGLLGSAGDGGGQERPSAMPHPPSRRPWRRGGRANGGLVSHVRLGGRVARAAKTQRCGGGEGRGEDDVSFFSWRK